MSKLILFQGDSITDAGRSRENDRASGQGYARLTEAELGFTYPDSYANFVFAKHEGFDGAFLYTALREKGILVRHFKTERIKDYLRITVGSFEECQALLSALAEIVTI